MLLTQATIRQKLERAFTQQQAAVLAEVVETAYTDLVKTSDFNELKAIVRDLAEAQKGSEQRLGRLEMTVAELAEAQKQTQQELCALTKEVRALTQGLKDTRDELGGLSRSVGYALENEAYRMLPAFLKERYGLEVTERLVRTDIGGKEINLLGRARRNGRQVLLVGEVKLRLDERRRKGEQDILTVLKSKVAAVQQEYAELEVVPLLITHYARPAFLQKAQAQGIIVIQSFEW